MTLFFFGGGGVIFIYFCSLEGVEKLMDQVGGIAYLHGLLLFRTTLLPSFFQFFILTWSHDLLSCDH